MTASAQTASFAQRVLAFILDMLIASFAVALVLQIFWSDEILAWFDALRAALQEQGQIPVPPAFVFPVEMAIFAVYFCGSWLKKGATLGQRLLGLQVLNAKNLQRLSLNQVALRFAVLFGVVSIFGPLAPLVLCTVMLNNPQRRALHDLAGGSWVVRAATIQISEADGSSEARGNQREF